MSHHIRSVTSGQRTRDTSWLTFNSKEKASGLTLSSHSTLMREPQALPRAQIQPEQRASGLAPAHIQPRAESLEPRPELTFDVRNYQISPRPPRHRLSMEIPASTGHSSAVEFLGS